MAADCVAEAMAALESGMTYDAVNVSIDAAADALLSLTGAGRHKLCRSDF